jgi:hypothetical protein
MLPPPQQMRASHDSGLIFQFNAVLCEARW